MWKQEKWKYQASYDIILKNLVRISQEFCRDSDKILEDNIMRSLLFSLLFLPPPLDSCVLFLALFLRDSDKILEDIIMRSLLFSLLFLPHPPPWFLCLVSCIILERFLQYSWRYYQEKLVIFSFFLLALSSLWFLYLLSCIILKRFWQNSWQYYHKKLVIFSTPPFTPPTPLDSCILFLALFLRDSDKIIEVIIMRSLLFSLLFLPHPTPPWFLCLISCIILERFLQDSWR